MKRISVIMIASLFVIGTTAITQSDPGLEHIVICGTQIMTTVIVTPLGVFAIAANSFAITAESFCICPVRDCRCCTTLVGQSIGADRRKLVRSFARITIFIWYDRYGVIGVLMYLFAP